MVISYLKYILPILVLVIAHYYPDAERSLHNVKAITKLHRSDAFKIQNDFSKLAKNDEAYISISNTNEFITIDGDEIIMPHFEYINHLHDYYFNSNDKMNKIKQSHFSSLQQHRIKLMDNPAIFQLIYPTLLMYGRLDQFTCHLWLTYNNTISRFHKDNYDNLLFQLLPDNENSFREIEIFKEEDFSPTSLMQKSLVLNNENKLIVDEWNGETFIKNFYTGNSIPEKELYKETLKAGEVIMIPANYFHKVKSINKISNEPLVAVNCWKVLT